MKNVLSKKSILIVDDDAEFAESVALYIEDFGGSAVIIHDGNMAIEYLRNEKVDLLLLDLCMPGINGLDVISEIRKREIYLPIIVISGTSNIKDAVEAVRQGADDFVAKPIVNFEELEFAVSRLFQKIELKEELEEYRKNLELMVNLRTAQLESKSNALEISNRVLNEEIEKRIKAENYIKRGSVKIINALEEERKKLSLDLHDSIGQKLMFTKLSIEMYLRGKMTDQSHLNKAVENIDQIGEELRSLIKDLYPQSIEKYSITQNLNTLVQKMRNLSDINYELETSGTDNIADSKTKLYLFRIFQESLNNIIKHSNAGNVKIVLSFGASSIKAEIQDDGSGMALPDNDSPGYGTGLFSMRERAEQLNGTLKMISRPGLGTKINLEIPL